MRKPSADQWPQITVWSALLLPGTSNHGKWPAGASVVSPLVRNSMTPSGVQKRKRVMALTITRRRSIPRKLSSQRSGREP